MRILQVISNLDPRSGGPATALLGLAPAQKRDGLDAEVVATFAPDYQSNVQQQLESTGVKVHLVGPVEGRLGRHPELESTVSRAIVGADVVHIHGLWEEIQHVASLMARDLELPYIFRPCGML